MRALLVQNDASAARALDQRFRSSGVIADVAETAADAFELARHYDYDLVIADTGPGADGGELVRRLRGARINTPALLLCQGTDSASRVRAFAAGADDVLAVPFDAAELLARMRAVHRRSKGFAGASMTVGSLTIHQDSHEVTVGDREVRLTGKEYAILELMVLRRGSVLTKDAFLNHIYGGMDEPEAKIIDVFICKLRKKLAVAGASHLITTVWGRGYMLKEASFVPPAGARSAGTPAMALSAA